MFTHLYHQRQYFKEAEVRLYGARSCLPWSICTRWVRTTSAGCGPGHQGPGPGGAVNLAASGFLEGVAHGVGGLDPLPLASWEEGLLGSPPLVPPRGLSSHRELHRLLPGATFTELPQTETSCLGSQSCK